VFASGGRLAGCAIGKRYFSMRIEIEERPAVAVWPSGAVVRDVVLGEDDEPLFEFIMTAFDWPGRELTATFEQRRDYVIGVKLALDRLHTDWRNGRGTALEAR
jgi:hypothetical protein